MGISIPARRDLHVETGPCPSVHRDNVLNMFIALPYRSGHDGAAVMLPRFVIKWLQNQLTKRPHLSDMNHDDIIKWKHFPRYWPFVRGIHRSPVNSPHKGQWRGALMFSLICVWINDWVNNHETGDLRRYRAHYDVIVMHVFSPELLLGPVLYLLAEQCLSQWMETSLIWRLLSLAETLLR